MRSAVRIAKDSQVAEISVFQKPQEFRAAKDRNLNARKSKFPVFRNQLFAERWTSILGETCDPSQPPDRHIIGRREAKMTPRAVSLPVTPALTLECKFWLEDDSWVGMAEGVPITIVARSFADAKKMMEERLASYLQDLLRSGAAARSQSVA
jgi:hypothetical protein